MNLRERLLELPVGTPLRLPIADLGSRCGCACEVELTLVDGFRVLIEWIGFDACDHAPCHEQLRAQASAAQVERRGRA